MSDRKVLSLNGIWFFTIGIYICALINEIYNDKKFNDIDIQVTELKQQLKESQQHADLLIKKCKELVK